MQDRKKMAYFYFYHFFYYNYYNFKIFRIPELSHKNRSKPSFSYPALTFSVIFLLFWVLEEFHFHLK